MAKKKTDREQAKATREAGGKRLAAAREGIDPDSLYVLGDAVKMVKERAKAKFDETVEIALNLGIDVKPSNQQVRGVVAMPNGVGKDVKVAVFAQDKKADEAKKAGADIVGAEELIEQIKKGEINFDRAIATPDMMPRIGQVAKILGPRGLMPNPKLGTVTADVADAVKAAKSGQVEFKAEKAGIIHAGIGKASFNDKALLENIAAFVAAINKAKPEGAKGIYIRKAALSSTMGPGVRLDTGSLVA